MWSPAHPGPNRRLARTHHIFRCRDHRQPSWLLDAKLGGPMRRRTCCIGRDSPRSSTLNINSLERPHLTMADQDRGAVFMRWKERFFVPDHGVQDIDGASFAGQNFFLSRPQLAAIPHRTPQVQHSLLTSPHFCRFLLRVRGLRPSYTIRCSLDNTRNTSRTRHECICG